MKEKDAAVVAVLPPLCRTEALEAPEPERKVCRRTPRSGEAARRAPRLRAQNVRAPPRGHGAETETFYNLERNIRKQ